MTLSAFCQRMQALLDQQTQAKTEEARRQAVQAMAEFWKAHSQGRREPQDYKLAQSGRDE